MSADHHGSQHDQDPAEARRAEESIKRLVAYRRELEALKRFSAQLDATARRAYPAGRMGADDDGELAYAVATDTEHGTVVIRFGKAVEWIGLGPTDLQALIGRLAQGYQELTGNYPFGGPVPAADTP